MAHDTLEEHMSSEIDSKREQMGVMADEESSFLVASVSEKCAH